MLPFRAISPGSSSGHGHRLDPATRLLDHDSQVSSLGHQVPRPLHVHQREHNAQQEVQQREAHDSAIFSVLLGEDPPCNCHEVRVHDDTEKEPCDVEGDVY